MDDSEPLAIRVSMLFFRHGSVSLCRRIDEEGVYVLPGGTPRPGEGTAAAVRREVAEETGLHVAAERVAFVLETTSWEGDHHLIEIIFIGSEHGAIAVPAQREQRLEPVFVPVDHLQQLRLRPPIGGYIKGFARSGGSRAERRLHTASYLGNVWRAPHAGADDS